MIRVGTRGSQLALWQTKEVIRLLSTIDIIGKEEVIQTYGDQHLDQPIYQSGIQGAFTRSLDIALLNDKIDLAVHSLKDVPTLLAENLVMAAVLPRGPHGDVLISSPEAAGKDLADYRQLASGSLRRRAQWLSRYPQAEFHGLRGNIQTRLQKLEDRPWEGIIMAAAAIHRLGLEGKYAIQALDWMVPAPAQGAIAVVCRADQTDLREALQKIDHRPSHLQAQMERSFLRELQAGCSAPVGALARWQGENIHFEGVVLSLDGKKKVQKAWEMVPAEFSEAGIACAKEIYGEGGAEILTSLAHAE